MATAQKAPPSLLDKLAGIHAPPDLDRLSTLGRNFLTGVVNDPLRVRNVPDSIITTAVKKGSPGMSSMTVQGWRFMTPEMVTNNPSNTVDFYIEHYTTEDAKVCYDDLNERMYFLWGYKAEIEAYRAGRLGRWNAQLNSQYGQKEEARVKSRKHPELTGALTMDGGNQALVGFAESEHSYGADDNDSDLFPEDN